MLDINKHIHYHFHIDKTSMKLIMTTLSNLNTKINKIMSNIQELNEKVDALQIALDAEQEQIAAALATLNQAIVDLQALVAEGGTAEERQALADKLDAIKADLEGTIPDETVE